MNPQAVLLFAVPPVIGAVIGLFTNWLAIKMLFRPLRAYRVLGLKLPFTPGILPRERGGIARSLGDTVSEDLLTQDAVEARLSSPAFVSTLEGAVAQGAGRVLALSPAELAGGIGTELGGALKEAAARSFSSLADSQAFRAGADAALGALVTEIGPLKLSELGAGASSATLAGRMDDPAFKDALASLFSDAAFACVDKALAEGAGLSLFVSRAALEDLARAAAKAVYPAFSGAVSGLMDDPVLRKSMERIGAKLVRKTLDRFSTVQRFFIGLGQYDRAILDNMPATIADFSEGLRTILGDEGNRNALIDRVARMVGDAVDRPLSSWDAFSSPERTAESKDALFAALRSALDRPRPADRPGLLGTAIGSLRVDGLLAALPGLRDALAGSAVDWLAAALSGRDRQDGDTGSSAGRRSLACIARAFSEAFVRKAEGSALGELSGMDDALVQRLAAAAGPALASLAARESGSLLRSLDVRGLVVEKIDSLEMIEVERMLLRVIDKELRAVTWFGGILGMLIGLVQSVLFLLR